MFTDHDFLSKIAQQWRSHSRESLWYQENSKYLNSEVRNFHSSTSGEVILLGEIGEIYFPYFQMGNIDSSALFGLDELILFSFYFINQRRYSKCLDLGANIGLHTLILRKLGFEVVSYEPDIVHSEQIKRVLKSNSLDFSPLRLKAISDQRGTMEYIRVLGNTTGSHLLGSKEEVYGPTEVVSVEVDDILEVLEQGKFDFVKMDVEGHEVVLLNRLTADSIQKTDIMLEIGSEKNAIDIFEILGSKKIPAYSQKTNWGRVEKLEDLPSHHTHGSLFVSMQGPPSWN